MYIDDLAMLGFIQPPGLHGAAVYERNELRPRRRKTAEREHNRQDWKLDRYHYTLGVAVGGGGGLHTHQSQRRHAR